VENTSLEIWTQKSQKRHLAKNQGAQQSEREPSKVTSFNDQLDPS